MIEVAALAGLAGSAALAGLGGLVGTDLMIKFLEFCTEIFPREPFSDALALLPTKEHKQLHQQPY